MGLLDCKICEQLFYPYSGARRRLHGMKFICNTCYSYLNKKNAKNDFAKIPPLSPLNNLRMNDIPDELKGLNDLELRLLAPRQVFIWMHPKPVSGEKYVRGNLVLVPANPQQSIHALRSKMTVPCNDSLAQVIRLDLKRRLSDKKAHISSTIRPDLVAKAAKALACTPLYKNLGITFDENWDPSQFQTDLTEEFIQENNENVGPHYSRPIPEEEQVSKDETMSFSICYADRWVHFNYINIHDSVGSLVEMVRSVFQPHEFNNDFYLRNANLAIKLFVHSPQKPIKDLGIPDGSVVHLVHSYQLDQSCFWLRLPLSGHQVFVDGEPDEITIYNVYDALANVMKSFSDFSPCLFIPSMDACRFYKMNDKNPISYDKSFLTLAELGIDNFSLIDCHQDIVPRSMQNGEQPKNLNICIYPGNEKSAVCLQVPVGASTKMLREKLEALHFSVLENPTFLCGGSCMINLMDDQQSLSDTAGINDGSVCFLKSEKINNSIDLCFLDSKNLSRVFSLEGTVNNLTIGDFLLGLDPGSRMFDFDIYGDYELEVHGTRFRINDALLEFSLEELNVCNFAILKIINLESDDETDHALPTSIIDLDESNDSPDNSVPKFTEAYSDTLSYHEDRKVKQNTIEVVDVIDDLEDDGIEALTVDSDSFCSDTEMETTECLDDLGFSTFTSSYKDSNSGCPQVATAPLLPSNDEIDKLQRLKEDSSTVSFGSIPSKGYIDVEYVEKYVDLMMKNMFVDSIETDHFLSPLSLAQLGAGANLDDWFPNFVPPESLQKTVLLHYLPKTRHYVVSHHFLENERCIVVYDSNHFSGHLQDMVRELKAQLNKLYKHVPHIKVCCPQTSLPYSDHALFALATFQVLAMNGDPCHVRFKPGKMRERMQSLGHDASMKDLLFAFSVSDKPVEKANKKFPWLGKLFDFSSYYDDDDDEHASEEEPSPDGLFTTMLTNRELVSDLEVKNAVSQKKSKRAEKWDNILSVAPSENQKPRNPFMDKHAEEMTYCSLFGGKPRSKTKIPVSYHKICKWELRHKNRRFARHHENLFFKTRKSMIKLLADLEMVSLRKVVKKDGSTYTAKDLKLNKENILHHNEGYKFLKSVRGSPAYFEKIKKNLFAMMRYHGKPTFFCTFTAAENQWTDLLRNLGRLIDKKEYTDAEIENMDAKEKKRLILADPVTCARHFNHRTRVLFSEFLGSPQGPLGEMKEFFYRVEFQNRGSPHLHCLLWMKDAPILGLDSEDQVAAYVDKFVTCSDDLNNISFLSLDERRQLIARQTHRHTRTCPQKGKVCRFNFPKPPMDKTTILLPFEKGTKEKPLTSSQLQEMSRHKANFKKIEETLNNWSEQPQNHKMQSMLDFIKYLDMSYIDYINAIRSSIHVDTVFLKRTLDQRWINSYNPQCLAVWKANMDCQYVVNGYAAAAYILDYVTKGERGLSETLRVASKEAAFKQMNHKASVRHIANRFIDYVETGAQEAAYYMLGIQLYNSSNAVVFIPTAEDSAKLCKSESEYMEMDDEDTDIFVKNSTDRYMERPNSLKNICLAEYVAYYDGLGSYHKALRNMDPSEEFAEEKESEQVDDDEPPSEASSIKLNGLSKRKKPRIIRYINFNVETQEEEHYRELLLLFFPFRNISALKGNFETYKERYQEVKDYVDQQRSIYSKYESEFRGLENITPHPDEDEDNLVMAGLAPGVVQAHGDSVRQQQVAEQNLPLPERTPSALLSRSYHYDDEWSESFFHKEAAKLNKKQFQFVNFFLHKLKQGSNGDQILWFLSGGAGVGKTTAVNVLYEAAKRYFNSVPGLDHSALHIVKCAFTGKASHQVRGHTINTLFKMPFGTQKKREQLTGSKLAELQAKMGDLKVLIIDEISMVDNEMWIDMSQRLCRIKERDDVPFGGVHVLAVGDLFQLLPVKGRPVWQMQNIDAHSQINGRPLAFNLWEEEIKMFELDEIMRQRDEKHWAQFLNRLREAPLSDVDKTYISEQIIPRESPIIPDANYITLTNDRCDTINNSWFSLAPPEKRFVIPADDKHAANAPISPDTIDCNIASIGRGEVQNLPAKLNLAIDHEYDFTSNLDVNDGITNGTPCIAKKYTKNSSKGDIVWVDPQDARVGRLWRQTYQFLYDNSIPNNWLPVLRQSIPCKSKYFTRKQFPLRAAKARTVNRTQGATLSKIVVDFSDRKGHTSHCHYVAFSRCPSKSNVSILGHEGLAETKIRHDVRCVQEMERLRLNGKLDMSMPCLFDMQDEYNSVLFMNSQSVIGKLVALENDWNVKGCCIFGIVDTRFQEGKAMPMKEFGQPSVHLSSNDRPSMSVALYSKIASTQNLGQNFCQNGVIVTAKYPKFYKENEQFCDIILFFLYIMPESSIQVYKEAANLIAIVAENTDPLTKMAIFGDFNKNPVNMPKEFTTVMQTFGMKQLINSPTHLRQNTLDHIYTNINSNFIKFGVLNTLTKSDHLPIYLAVKKEN